uniref:hypothetical protein n=1 Tax=Nonomuraea sp. CA-251285 TaxID=3240002 RepID=UPI003F496D22
MPEELAAWEKRLLGQPLTAEEKVLLAHDAETVANPVLPRRGPDSPPMRARGGPLRPVASGTGIVTIAGLDVGLRGQIDAVRDLLQQPDDQRRRYVELVLHRAGLRSRRRDGHGYVIATKGGYALEVPLNDYHPGAKYLLYSGANTDLLDLSRPFDDPADDGREYAYDPTDDLDGTSAGRGWGPGWAEADE